MSRKDIPRTRCSGTLTESQYWSWIRSQLRRASYRWKPLSDVMVEQRVPLTPEIKAIAREKFPARSKYAYHCEMCDGYFPRNHVQKDHIIPCGSLTQAKDLPRFVERLFCEADGIRLLCRTCHAKVTKAQRMGVKVSTLIDGV